MELVTYRTGEPEYVGVYACRVPMDGQPGLHEDRFLMWFNGTWGHLGSDQAYRGTVVGWVGPLQRTRSGPGTAPFVAGGG